VKTGLKQDGLYEVVSGVSAGDVVAVDGAGFLTDGAAVTLSKPRPAGSRSAGEAG